MGRALSAAGRVLRRVSAALAGLGFRWFIFARAESGHAASVPPAWSRRRASMPTLRARGEASTSYPPCGKSLDAAGRGRRSRCLRLGLYAVLAIWVAGTKRQCVVGPRPVLRSGRGSKGPWQKCTGAFFFNTCSPATKKCLSRIARDSTFAESPCTCTTRSRYTEVFILPHYLTHPSR